LGCGPKVANEARQPKHMKKTLLAGVFASLAAAQTVSAISFADPDTGRNNGAKSTLEFAGPESMANLSVVWSVPDGGRTLTLLGLSFIGLAIGHVLIRRS
jgi:hypothetical protein